MVTPTFGFGGRGGWTTFARTIPSGRLRAYRITPSRYYELADFYHRLWRP